MEPVKYAGSVKEFWWRYTSFRGHNETMLEDMALVARIADEYLKVAEKLQYLSRYSEHEERMLVITHELTEYVKRLQRDFQQYMGLNILRWVEGTVKYILSGGIVNDIDRGSIFVDEEKRELVIINRRFPLELESFEELRRYIFERKDFLSR